jgi:cytoskeleton protein RodZ
MFQIGQSLHDARVARGLELDKVAEQTMIRARYVAALEAERFDLLPGDAYTRLFLREYAVFLGLDPKPFLDQLAAQVEENEPIPFTPSPLPPRRLIGSRRLLALAALVAVAATITLVAWKLGGGHNPRLPAVQTHPRRAQQSRAPARPAHAARPRPKPAGPHLVLTAARGPVWLLVRMGSTDGKVLYENTLQTGQTLAFGRRTLWIRIGAPSSLDLRLDGRPTSIPPSSRPENILVSDTGRLRPA